MTQWKCFILLEQITNIHNGETRRYFSAILHPFAMLISPGEQIHIQVHQPQVLPK